MKRQQAVALVGAGYSHREVGAMLSISRTPEMRAMEKVNAHQRQEDAYRAGRPRKYSPADNRLLLRQLRKARDQTAEEVQHEAFGLWATGHAREKAVSGARQP